MRKWMNRLVLFASTLLGIGATSGCGDDNEIRVMPGVQESGYVMPFPLQQGGEHIDLLVRVRDNERPHQFNLIFVMRHDWPEEKKDVVLRIYDGFVDGNEGILPYPVKLKIRIDSVAPSNDVHVEQIVSDRNRHSMTPAENGTVAWFAQRVYVHSFPPGIYRVRVDNLAPLPQIDFRTLFEFRRLSRKV